jgi:hypothetical protein
MVAPIEYERRPRCRVTVSPGTARESNLPLDADGLPRTVDITSHVKRLRTVKALSSPVGTFELGMTFQGLDEVERSSLNRILVPDNLVTIELDAGLPDSDLETVMLGWIGTVGARTTVAPSGQVVREVTVQGQDAGKFLVRHELPTFAFSGFLMGLSEEKVRFDEGIILRGIVGEVLRQLFRYTFDELVPAPHNVRRGVELLTDPALDGEGEGALRSFLRRASVWDRQGKWWNLFLEFCDRPWNEAFGDYVPDVAAAYEGYTSARSDPRFPRIAAKQGPGYYLVVRPQPFDRTRWAHLPTTTISDAEIRLEDMRLSDDERINLVMVPVGSKLGASAAFPGEFVKFGTVHLDRDSALRHGTYGLHTGTIYADLGEALQDGVKLDRLAATDSDVLTALQARARKLWDWYSVNHRLWKGVWVIAGDPSLRIGQRVQNERGDTGFFDPNEYERRVYYVERVVQDYADGLQFFTHLALVRGESLDHPVRASDPDPEPLRAFRETRQ